MAGTFYRSPAPGEPPFVRKGDKVTKGQTVGIVEAMKLMNEIEVCHQMQAKATMASLYICSLLWLYRRQLCCRAFETL